LFSGFPEIPFFFSYPGTSDQCKKFSLRPFAHTESYQSCVRCKVVLTFVSAISEFAVEGKPGRALEVAVFPFIFKFHIAFTQAMTGFLGHNAGCSPVFGVCIRLLAIFVLIDQLTDPIVSEFLNDDPHKPGERE